MSVTEILGPARLLGVAGLFAVCGSMALGDAPMDTPPRAAIDASTVSFDPDGIAGMQPDSDPGIEIIDLVIDEATDEPIDLVIDISPEDMVYDDGCIDCVYPSLDADMSTTMVPEMAQSGAAALPRSERHEQVVTVGLQTRNICTEADLYVAWLCSWQGYARP